MRRAWHPGKKAIAVPKRCAFKTNVPPEALMSAAAVQIDSRPSHSLAECVLTTKCTGIPLPSREARASKKSSVFAA
jgi:hypothetical protein